MTHGRLVSQLSNTLRGGAAPAYWRQGIKQKTVTLVAVQRGGLWVHEFGAIHPRLCDYPLLGYALTSLTGQTDATQETPPEATRSAKARSAQWQRVAKPNRTIIATANKPKAPAAKTVTPRQPTVTKRPVVSTQTLLQLTAQADYLLLRNLAGDDAHFDSTRLFSAHANRSNVDYGDLATQQDWLNHLIHSAATANMQRAEQSPLLHKQGALLLDGVQASSELLKQASSAQASNGEGFRPPLPNDNDSATQQNWLNRVAKRAGKVSLQPTPNTAQTPPHLSSLQAQWAMPLDGIQSSLALLNQLVQNNYSDETNVSVTPPQQSPSTADLQGESFSGSNKIKPNTTRLDFPEYKVNQQQGYSGSATTSSIPTMPPNLTASLPDLLAPQQVDTQPLPIATATVRQGARAETLKATDDLDNLASKINQILDEQARRHGIDV